MNKGTKIALIIAVIVCLIAIVVVGIFALANKEKEVISTDTFQNMMKENGYNVINAITAFDGIDEIKDAYIALDEENSYEIEFYELVDEETAEKFYNSNKSSFEKLKENTSVETNIHGKNYEKYTLNSEKSYMVISRINNTVIYVAINSEYREKIQEVLNIIGY